MAAVPFTGSRCRACKVTVYDGNHHWVDSKEITFVQAGKEAFFDTVEKAPPRS